MSLHPVTNPQKVMLTSVIDMNGVDQVFRLNMEAHDTLQDFIPLLELLQKLGPKNVAIVMMGDTDRDGVIQVDERYVIVVSELQVLRTDSWKGPEGVAENLERRKKAQAPTYLFPDHFGRDFTFTAKAVEKPNTYFHQRLLESSCLLELTSIGGEKLAKPVIVEPVGEVLADLKVGRVHQFRGFERLREMGRPRIAGEHPPKMELHYRNQIVVFELLAQGE